AHGAVVGREMEPGPPYLANAVELSGPARAEEKDVGTPFRPELPPEEEERGHAAAAGHEDRRAAGTRREADPQGSEQVPLPRVGLHGKRPGTPAHHRAVDADRAESPA